MSFASNSPDITRRSTSHSNFNEHPPLLPPVGVSVPGTDDIPSDSGLQVDHRLTTETSTGCRALLFCHFTENRGRGVQCEISHGILHHLFFCATWGNCKFHQEQNNYSTDFCCMLCNIAQIGSGFLGPRACSTEVSNKGRWSCDTRRPSLLFGVSVLNFIGSIHINNWQGVFLPSSFLTGSSHGQITFNRLPVSSLSYHKLSAKATFVFVFVCVGIYMCYYSMAWRSIHLW